MPYPARRPTPVVIANGSTLTGRELVPADDGVVQLSPNPPVALIEVVDDSGGRAVSVERDLYPKVLLCARA